MPAPLVRQPKSRPDLESSTRLKQADVSEELDGRSALNPSPPSGKVKMKIPRGMPPLPGGRAMPPLPVLLRESLAPLRRSFAPLRRSLAPLLGAPSGDELAPPLPTKRRWPFAVGLALVVAAGVAAWWALVK